jgi:hypothetical protein
MSLNQAPTAGSNWIVQPPCPKCCTNMLLARIEPDSPRHDRRTFECPVCEYTLTTVVKFE